MTSPQARFMVCGHWPGALPQAFLEKMEGGVPNPTQPRHLPKKSDLRNEVLLPALEKAGDHTSYRSLLACSYKPISASSVPNSPSRSHCSLKLEDLVPSALQASSHLPVLAQPGWQPEAAPTCLVGASWPLRGPLSPLCLSSDFVNHFADQ